MAWLGLACCLLLCFIQNNVVYDKRKEQQAEQVHSCHDANASQVLVLVLLLLLVSQVKKVDSTTKGLRVRGQTECDNGKQRADESTHHTCPEEQLKINVYGQLAGKYQSGLELGWIETL